MEIKEEESDDTGEKKRQIMRMGIKVSDKGKEGKEDKNRRGRRAFKNA